MDQYLKLMRQIDWEERGSVYSGRSTSSSVASNTTSGFISGGGTSATSGSTFGDSNDENQIDQAIGWIPKDKKYKFLIIQLVDYIYWKRKQEEYLYVFY